MGENIKERSFVRKLLELNENVKERALPSWQEFQQAMQAFAGDLAIVGHAQEQPVSPFGKPKEYGEYTLTQLPNNMNKQSFAEQMGQVDRIVITCMDKRVAGPVWRQLAGEEGKALFLAVGGGVVQNRDRAQAMKTIAQFLGQFFNNIQKVWLTDHNHVCGAVKFFLKSFGLENEAGLPGMLQVEPGAEEEDQTMEKLIRKGAEPWVKAFGDKVRLGLVKVDEESQGVEIKGLVLPGETLTVENLAVELAKNAPKEKNIIQKL